MSELIHLLIKVWFAIFHKEFEVTCGKENHEMQKQDINGCKIQNQEINAKEEEAKTHACIIALDDFLS